MKQRDHGGNLDDAMRRHGGLRGDWLDLSTGINPLPYPVPRMDAGAWGALPLKSEVAALEATAARAFGVTGSCACVALAGASAAIQLVPRLVPSGTARILGPTYNEHAAALRAEGWAVSDVATRDALQGADLAVVVNPNNPDGRSHRPDELAQLSQHVGLLVVDESFADATPGVSTLPHWETVPQTARVIVLRSFGKFYGLAGARLGFALGHGGMIDTLRRMAGPWAVSGPALAAGRAAYADAGWQEDTLRRLSGDAARLDALAQAAGWSLVGGTPLFRTYATPDAKAAQAALAAHHVWTRIFPYSRHWIRLGLPATQDGWKRLGAALA